MVLIVLAARAMFNQSQVQGMIACLLQLKIDRTETPAVLVCPYFLLGMILS